MDTLELDDASLFDAIMHEPSGLYVFWRFRKRSHLAELSLVFHEHRLGQPAVEPLPGFLYPMPTQIEFGKGGRVKRLACCWTFDQIYNAQPWGMIGGAVGVRVQRLVSDLCDQAFELGCDGWLRVPDGDIDELVKAWTNLHERSAAPHHESQA
ncbi:MAG TPA: hypothetical protein VLE72_00025 [Candidatus Saccharimonadales bacterium]|nr:hypothetical protein [Candidatus Saccharimonadales bacterium]